MIEGLIFKEFGTIKDFKYYLKTQFQTRGNRFRVKRCFRKEAEYSSKSGQY